LAEVQADFPDALGMLMKLSPELYFLTLSILATALMWVPYVVTRIVACGLWSAVGNPSSWHPPGPAWAQRARLAHANAVENLAVFAPLVLAAAYVGASTPATIVAAKVYLFARIVHYIVYAAGIPVVRTLAFLTGFGATLVFVIELLGHVS
jgi:uncharacterized MAPEG superfamily protein